MMTCARTSPRPRRRCRVIFGGVTHNYDTLYSPFTVVAAAALEGRRLLHLTN